MGRPKKIIQNIPSVTKKYTNVPGVADVLSVPTGHWHATLNKLDKVANTYGFARTETPMLEERNLFENYYGKEHDELNKLITTELAGKNWAIRSSVLPGLLRAYVQQKVFDQEPFSKWFSYGNIVKNEGKLALHSDYQYVFEVLGTFNHLTESQVIGAVWTFFQGLGLKRLSLEINSLGQSECQAVYADALKDFVKGKKFDLCDGCNEHVDNGKVFGVLRCTNIDCQTVLAEAPTSLNFLDEASHKHFTNILEALDELGIPYQLNPLLAGPEGFTRTCVVIKEKIGDKTYVLGEAGYHEKLMQNVCGKPYCSFGFTGLFSTLEALIKAEQLELMREISSEVFLVPLGELASKKSLRLFQELVREKITVFDNFGSLGVKNQLKLAETYKSPIALIMGQKEAVDEMVILRDVKSGMQEMFSYDKIVNEVKKRLGK